MTGLLTFVGDACIVVFELLGMVCAFLAGRDLLSRRRVKAGPRSSKGVDR